MGPTARVALWYAGLALALLVLRAAGAALEAALVGVGLTRAEEMAREHGARWRARALASLFATPESTGAVLRLWAALCACGAGALGALAAAPATGIPLFWLRAAGGVFGATLVSVALAAAGRRIGAVHGKAVALALAPVAWALRKPLGPVGRVLALVVSPIARGAGQYALPRPPLEEVERGLAEYAKGEGTPQDQSTSELIHRVFKFREKVARDVMVPRTNVVAMDIDTPVPEIIRVLAEEGHSRIPVYRGNLDQIVGTLHARDMVPLLAHPEIIILGDLLRPTHFVPWSKPVDQLLREMQHLKLHMAVVVDEYGGVMGICTLEDVLEEIVGEIRDEYEADERKLVEAHADGTFTARGSAPVSEFNRASGAGIPEDRGYETVAGFLNALAGAIPSVGDRFLYRGWMFTVAEADPRRATRIRAARLKRASSP